MSQVFISAAHKSSGKTLVSTGLCAVYRRRGMRVAAFKKGPDYIDPAWLTKASGGPCWNLDFFTMSQEEILACFEVHRQGAEVTVVEGNKGLFDGLDVKGSDSNAALAVALDLPVLLVIDVTGITRGIAPLLAGYTGFDPDVRIAGVILNRVAGPRQESKLRAAIECYSDLPVLGAIGRDPRLVIEERHLGLVPGNEDPEASARIEKIADVIEATVDLDAVLALTGRRQKPESVAVSAPAKRAADKRDPVRIGIARDRAFGFYYPDDLDAFENAGAELVPFNTLEDEGLPQVEGLFIGGGFPEYFLEELSANVSLREDIRAFIENGGPGYAECGGLMYLSRSIAWQGSEFPMVGVIAGDTKVSNRPVGRGYMRLRAMPNHPWPQVQAASGRTYNVHEFHYSSLEMIDSPLTTVYSVDRGHGLDGTRDGIRVHNLLATYAHQRHVAANPWVNAFVDFVRAPQG
ncbi:MAG: cobyrinate a,c-diamide synthase [Proteobacteria bacterium]|nr:cobyrinate a,c-diamide synthase [Pseudomonadota bacterium]MBT6347743.1 cobyrinate a,c-diamide synthase [Pseudomonadota bacterium]